jgi:ubiquinone/menaquinone biosynthesis C-methylase UbiE
VSLLWWIIALLAISGIGWLLWWLLIESEGVYLGRRVVIWLYDLYAARYDDIKRYRPEADHQYLAQPIMQRIAPIKTPLMLDVATGTARLPIAMLRHPQFHGRVIGVDLAKNMLFKAAYKLGDETDDRAPLIWCPAENLPFDDDTFDVVTCLEALEFMKDPRAVLHECIRVLRPGGILLTTNRISTRLMPGKTWDNDRIAQELLDADMDEIEIEAWQLDYNLVWGIRMGSSMPTLSRPLTEILRCPRCGLRELRRTAAALSCDGCGCEIPVTFGVIEMTPLLRG